MAERTLAEVPTWEVVAAVWTSVWCCAPASRCSSSAPTSLGWSAAATSSCPRHALGLRRPWEIRSSFCRCLFAGSSFLRRPPCLNAANPRVLSRKGMEISRWARSAFPSRPACTPCVCVLALFLALASDSFFWGQRTRQPPATPNTTFHSPCAAITLVFRVILAQGPETLLPRLIRHIVRMMHWWALHLKEQQRPPAAMVALLSCHSADFSDISTSVLDPSFRVSVTTSSHRSLPSPVTCYRRHLSKYST